MTSRDKDILARAADGRLFENRPGCTLGDFPALRDAFRHENYLIRDATPKDRMVILAQMLLRDVYDDVQFAE